MDLIPLLLIAIPIASILLVMKGLALLKEFAFRSEGFRLVRSGDTNVAPFVHMGMAPYGGGVFHSNGRWLKYQLNAPGRLTRYPPPCTVLEIEVPKSLRFKVVPELHVAPSYAGAMKALEGVSGVWGSGGVSENAALLNMASYNDPNRVGLIARHGRLYVVHQGTIYFPYQVRRLLAQAEKAYRVSCGVT